MFAYNFSKANRPPLLLFSVLLSFLAAPSLLSVLQLVTPRPARCPYKHAVALLTHKQTSWQTAPPLLFVGIGPTHLLRHPHPVRVTKLLEPPPCKTSLRGFFVFTNLVTRIYSPHKNYHTHMCWRKCTPLTLFNIVLAYKCHVELRVNNDFLAPVQSWPSRIQRDPKQLRESFIRVRLIIGCFALEMWRACVRACVCALGWRGRKTSNWDHQTFVVFNWSSI